MSVDSNGKEWMRLSEDIHVTIARLSMQLQDAEWRHEHSREYDIVESIDEDEIHEYSDGIFKDAMGIE